MKLQIKIYGEAKKVPHTYYTERELLKTIYVHGHKMSQAWLKKTYGANNRYKAMYHCKRNPYGIMWVFCEHTAFGELWGCSHGWTIVERIPNGDQLCVQSVGYR